MGGLVSMAAAAAIALGSPQTAPQQASQLPDVLITGQSPAEIARSFVDEAADPLPGFGPARWDGKICVSVYYLRRDFALHILSRIAAVAENLDLEMGTSGCRPNILIIAAADGQEMARTMVNARPAMFLTRVTGANQAGSELEAFQTSDRPVRWWHINLPVNRDTGEAVVRLPGRGPAASSGETGSRLRTEIQNDLQRVFIIVDFNRASGTQIGALSDYLAMVALAQINPDADMSSFDTVLNLFGDRSAPREMTDWDRAYLQALYGAYFDQRQPGAQLRAVARNMARARGEPADSEP